MRADRSPTSPRIAAFLAIEALSAIGSWATVLVIWGYAAYEFDATAADVALVGLSFSLPPVLLGPLAGTVVDRIGAKATLAAAKVLGIVAALALLGVDSFRAMAFLSFLHGIAAAFSLPALQSLPPRIVDEQHVARTNALVSLTDEFAIVAGPVVGGLAIAAFGFQGAFVIDALTYAIGLAALPLVRLAPRQRDPELADGEEEPEVRMRDALEGAKIIRRSPVLRRVVTSTFLVHTLYGVALLSEPLYVRDVLDRSPGTFAALQTAFGVFMVAGGIIAARLGDRLASFRFVSLGVVGSGITAVLYLGTPWIVAAFVGVCLWGAFTALISGPSRTVLQRGSPQSAHGRVLSTDLMAGSTGELVGIGLAGVLVTVVGVQWTAAAVGVTVAVAAIALSRARPTPLQASGPADRTGAGPASGDHSPPADRPVPARSGGGA